MSTLIEEMLGDAEIPVEYADQREEVLVRLAAQGQDVRSFLESPTGQYVIGAAVQDTVELERKIAKTWVLGPVGKRKLRRLQLEHKAIEMSIAWITESVKIGMDAERALQEPTE